MLKQRQITTQKQILVPQLHQSLKILQFSNLELLEEIKSEIIENPFLEEIEESNLEKMESQRKEEIDKSRQEIEESFEIYSHLKNPLKEDLEFRSLEWVPSQRMTLYDHLIHQLQLVPLSEKEYLIGKLLIEKINSDGYLECCLQCISKIVKEDIKTVEKVLKEIQKFEPPGIGALNLEETLLIQAEHLEILDENLEKMIKDHLNNIQKADYKKIAHELDISIEQVLDYVSQIKSLEPKPARLFGDVTAHYIIPDVIIRKYEEDYKIELYNDWLPTIIISPYYLNLLKSSQMQKEIKVYLVERLRKAKWFLKCIDQRQQTILAIAKAIFAHQTEFLEYGPKKLKALKMENIANSLGIHLSTVSRAISNKYIQTPVGLYSFKYFFAGGKEDRSGSKVSKQGIKERLKKMVEEEDKKNPLSDEEIASLFQKEGFRIARRTIAKYRDELKILPSNLRRER
jgi:RNA polymerase sigma-54 factor